MDLAEKMQHSDPASLSNGRNLFPLLLLVVALIAGAGLRAIDLSREPLSFDEAASVYIAKLPLPEVLEKNGAFNSSPPAMLVALHLMLRIGDSEAFVRAVSVLSGSVTILLVFFLVRQLQPTGYAPGVAALLFALSASQINLSREFRVYALGELFGAMGLLAALMLARRPSWSRAAITAILFFAGMQVQYAAAPFFAAAGLAVVCAKDIFRDARQVRFWQLALVAAASFLGVIVVYQTALTHQMYAGRGALYSPTLIQLSSSWFQTVLLFLAYTWLLIQAGLRMAGVPWSGVVLTLFCLYGVLTLARTNPRSPYLLTSCFSLAGFALLSLANLYPYGPTRQCLILTLPLYGLAAQGLMDSVTHRSRTYRAIALALLATGAASLFISERSAPPNRDADIREAIRVMRQDWHPGDVAFIPPGTFPIFAYYTMRMPISPWIAAEGSIEWMQDERAWRDWIGSEPPYTEQLDALLRSKDRVWLLYSHYHPGEMTLDELADRRRWTSRIQTVLRGRRDGGEGSELFLFRR